MKVNVLHFINNLEREGAQVMVSNLVTAADGSQISSSVCVRKPGGPLIAELRDQGINVSEPPRYFGFRSWRQSVNFLVRVCEENQIQIIHAHMADAAFLGWLAARKLNLPLIVSHHGHDILLKCSQVCRFVYYVLLNLAARYAVMNIAVSHSVAERVRKLLRIKEHKLQVISNGIPVPARSIIEAGLNRKHGQDIRLNLVNVGRLVPLKGQHQLIRAMGQLVNRFPAIRLYIVGGGEMAQKLKRQAEIEKIAKQVVFTGAVDDVAAYLEKADIYVSSSESEGMPVSILEAMAWQIPVVASDIPGNRSVIKHGETGFLYKLNNLEDLVETVIKVVENKDATRKVAASARLMIEQQYSVAIAEKNHADLYRSVLA